MSRKTTDRIRIGYIRLLDAAPIIVACELGLLKKEGIEIELHRQLGWASLEHKLALGELDAAHMLGPLPLAVNAGVAEARGHLVALRALSYMGNAITLSNELRQRGVESAEDLRYEIRSQRSSRRYTFGHVAPFSSHHFLLRTWLRSGGIDPDKDVNLVVIPPGQAVRTIRAGVVDGYCVGEPWNSLAVMEGIGWCPVWSQDIEAGHIEKVIAFPGAWYQENTALATALLDAIEEAGRYCEQAENKAGVASMIAHDNYLGVPARHLETLLAARIPMDDGELAGKPILAFARPSISNKITAKERAWLCQSVRECGKATITEEKLQEIAPQTYLE